MVKPRTFKTKVLERRIKRLEGATIEMSWEGAQPPEDSAAIHKEYREAQLALWTYIMEFILTDEKSSN